jgi:hypothetical protein
METLVQATHYARWATAAERLDDAVAEGAALEREALDIQATLNWHAGHPILPELECAARHLREARLALARAAASARAADPIAASPRARRVAYLTAMLAIP